MDTDTARLRVAALMAEGDFHADHGPVVHRPCKSTFHNMRGTMLVEALEAHLAKCLTAD